MTFPQAACHASVILIAIQCEGRAYARKMGDFLFDVIEYATTDRAFRRKAYVACSGRFTSLRATPPTRPRAWDWGSRSAVNWPENSAAI